MYFHFFFVFSEENSHIEKIVKNSTKNLQLTIAQIAQLYWEYNLGSDIFGYLSFGVF